jgi:hypothetical protein
MKIVFLFLPFIGLILASVVVYICFRKRFKVYAHLDYNDNSARERDAKKAVKAWLKSQQ